MCMMEDPPRTRTHDGQISIYHAKVLPMGVPIGWHTDCFRSFSTTKYTCTIEILDEAVQKYLLISTSSTHTHHPKGIGDQSKNTF